MSSALNFPINSSIAAIDDLIKTLIAQIEQAKKSGNVKKLIEYNLAYLYCLLFKGEKLSKVELKYPECFQLISQEHKSSDIISILIIQQLVANLLAPTDKPYESLVQSIDERELLLKLIQEDNIEVIFLLYNYQTRIRYLFYDYPAALETVQLAEKARQRVKNNLYELDHIFFYCLVLLANYPHLEAKAQIATMEKVQTNYQQLINYSQCDQLSFQPKCDLIAAELAKVQDDKQQARQFYQLAIAGAKKSKYLQDEALANELAGVFCLQADQADQAQIYLQAAYNCYLAWGARAKVNNLSNLYQDLLSLSEPSSPPSPQQAELMKLEAILQAQQESTPDGILVVDAEQKIICANNRLYQLIGCSSEGVQLKTHQQILDIIKNKLKNSSSFQQKIAEIYQNRDLVSLEQLNFQDNRSLEQYSAPIYLANQQYYGRIWYFRDLIEIDPDDKYQSSLDQSGYIYQQIIDQVSQPIAWQDMDGNYLGCNQSFAEQVGFTQSKQIKGKRHTDITWVDLPPKGKAKKTPLRNWQNKVVGMLTIYETDNSFLTTSTRNREIHHRILFNQAAIGLAEINPHNYQFTWVNSQLCQMLGYSQAELVEKSWLDLIPLIEREVAQYQLVNLAQPETNQLQQEQRYICANDEIVWCKTSIIKINKTNSEDNLYFLICNDITEQKKREEALHLILEGTTTKIEDEFFAHCIRSVADLLQVEYAFISQIQESNNNKCNSLIFSQKTEKTNSFSNDLAGTPCEEVVLREISHYPANVTEVFPHHTKLQELGAESYFGVAIFDQQEKVVGILGIIDTSPLKPEEVENQSLILNIFAARAGIELERKKTQTQLSKQADQLRQHNSVLTSLAKNQALHQGNLKEAFQDITEVIANTLKVEQVSVWLLNQEKTQLERQNMYQRSNNTHTQLYAAIELETAPTYQKTLDAQEVIALENPASLNVAIQLQGEKVGLLSVQEASISSRVWELEEEMFIRSTADLISLALQAQERNETQITLTRQIRRIVLLEQITQQIRQSLNPKIIFQTTVDQLGANFAASRCHLVSYVSKLAPIAPILAEYCAPAYEPLLGTTIPVKDDYFIQAVLSADKAVSLIEIEEEKELTTQTNFWREIALQSVLAVRSSYQGKANGMIILHQCDYARKWTEAEIELLESVAIQVGIAIAQSQLLEKEKKQREELSSKNHALIQATEEAEIANRAKSEFLAKMSHELRTPLNAILGFSQLMSRDSNTTPQQKETLDIINRSGEHLLQLINGVLDMSKIEAGKIELNCEDFNLHRCLNSLRDMFSLKAESKEIELKFELDPQLPRYFTTDQSKLRQILINLLSNAIKFTHSGYVALRVLVSSKQLVTDDVNTEELINLHFEIEDTGVGIAPEEIDSLFDLFVQTESGRKSEEGTGLGLPISRKFVQMMGGDLKVTSQVAQGSQFTFNIQGYAPKHIFTTDIGEKRIIGLADAAQPTNYRILIVDDRPESRLLMTKLLSSIGFVTNQASNGLEAIEIYQSWQPHLIFMDMHMPIMNGYEATPEIRLKAKMAEDNSLKIIACTASAFEENRARVLDVGCDDFLRKPYKENMLFEKIAEHLNVEYIYESVEVQAVSKEKGYITVSDEQIKAEIEQLPIDWLEKMHQAAICLDLAKSNQLIAEIRPNHTFLAERFQHYLDFLQFEQLIKYTSKT